PGDPDPDAARHPQRSAGCHTSRADRGRPGDDPLDRVPRSDDAGQGGIDLPAAGRRDPSSAALTGSPRIPPIYGTRAMMTAPRVAASALLMAGLALGAPPQSSGEVPSFARDVPTIRSGEPIFQFNGMDLSGFYPFVRNRGREDPNKVFTVRDGMICASG